MEALVTSVVAQSVSTIQADLLRRRSVSPASAWPRNYGSGRGGSSRSMSNQTRSQRRIASTKMGS